MQIIDRYLLRQFLQVFAICFCSLTGLYIVIDGFGNLEEFISFAEKQGRGLLSVMGEYYAYHALSFFDRTSATLTLIAAMFSVTWIQRHNELTALQAAGIAKKRVIVPVILAVAAISLMSAASRELVIPFVQEKLSRNAQDLGGSTGKNLQYRYDNATDILIRGTQTFSDQQRISQPNFLMPTGLDDYGKELIAENALYEGATADHPAGYLFDKVKQPKGLAEMHSLSLADGKPVMITPLDASRWLKPDQCFVVSGISFDQLEGGGAWRRLASTPALIHSLRNRSLDFGADVRVLVHSRIVQPFLDMTLLFLGLPLVLTRDNRNIFLAVGQCAAIVIGFMFVVLACQYLGASYLINPALAAWLPLMLFVPFAVALFDPLLE